MTDGLHDAVSPYEHNGCLPHDESETFEWSVAAGVQGRC